MLMLTGGKLYTITQGVIDAGDILIEDGKIIALGTDLAVPDEAVVIDITGKVVTPGLIDAHSHLAVFGEPFVWAHGDGNERTEPITPHLRAIDSLYPDDPGIKDVLSGGVTTVYTGPGSANIIGGMGMAIKLRGRTAEEMRIPGVEGMKMALGENPKHVYGRDQKKAPATRMGNAAVLREALAKAQNYLDKVKKAEDDDKDNPDRDLRMEALGRVLRREIKARIHCHRADDIMTAVRIGEEFNLDFTIEHATEAYKIADILAEKQVPCVVGPLHIGRFKMELKDITLKNPGILAKAGIKVCLQMDGFSDTRFLPIFAGLAVREGMPEEEALKALTINPAELLGVSDRLGSLEVGKDADIAVFDGHPFETMTKTELVLIDGEIVYRRSR